MSTPSPEAVSAATTALDNVRGDWMSRPEVVSVEVARQAADPAAVCVRVTIRPGADPASFPEDLGGVPVEIVTGTGPVPE